jgi:hypothetical protein
MPYLDFMPIDYPGWIREAYERVFADIMRFFEEWLGVQYYPSFQTRRATRHRLVTRRMIGLTFGVSVAVLAIIIARRGRCPRKI